MPGREEVDILVVGSGMGGATFAAGLAPSGARILILERGERLTDSDAVRDPRAIFQQGKFRPQESWLDGAGRPFNPGNYYYVGGNTKLYGAVLVRYRAQDFEPIVHRGGTTPGWPFSYEELEPWYTAAEKLYRVRGALGFDRTEPRHSKPYPFGPVPDEPAIAKVRERLKGAGLTPFPLPLGIDIDRWLRRAKTPWDAFPDAGHGKMDAESCGVEEALAHPNVELRTNARVERLIVGPDGRRIAGLEVLRRWRAQHHRGETRRTCRGRRQFSRVAAPIGGERPRKSFRRGRPAFHEPQRLCGGGDRSSRRQRLGLSKNSRPQ